MNKKSTQKKRPVVARKVEPVVRHFLTVEYICTCGWSVRVKTAAPKKHAIFYRQGIGSETCLRCRQVSSLANCSCCKPTVEVSDE